MSFARYTHYPPFDDDPYAADVAAKRAIDNLHRRPDQERDVVQTDRVSEYLFGGPRWHWFDVTNPGFPGDQSFSWVKDLSSVWGGYYESTQPPEGSPVWPEVADGEDSPHFIVGFPLGPRWSSWELNISISEGPDFGMLGLEVGTTPVVLTPEGHPDASWIGENLSPKWFDGPGEPGKSGWWRIGEGSWTHNCHRAAGTVNDQPDRIGPNHFRIAGKYGDMLTAHGFPEEYVTEEGEVAEEMLTGNYLNGGDGVWWWFRFSVPSRVADSSGYRMRFHAGRLVRNVENDHYTQ